MPGAGNTDACLHPRRVPGPGKPGWRFVNFVFVRLCMPGAGNTGACLRPRCVPGLGKPAAMRRQQHFLPGAPLLRHHYAHANSAPSCARGSMATSSTPATPTRHRSRHSSHGYLDTATPPTLSATSTTAQRAIIRLSNSSASTTVNASATRHRQRCSCYDCGGDVSPSAATLSSLTVRDAPVVRNATASSCGGMLEIYLGYMYLVV